MKIKNLSFKAIYGPNIFVLAESRSPNVKVKITLAPGTTYRKAQEIASYLGQNIRELSLG